MGLNPRELHAWDLEPAEAAQVQQGLRAYWRSGEGPLEAVRLVAGVDVSVRDGLSRAAVAVYSFPGLELVALCSAERTVAFPYIPGFLAFREAPAILDAFACLQAEPDLLIFDGHGLAHPRRMGIACHVGILLDKPSIGCAKSRLCGDHKPVPDAAGAWVYLRERDEVLGAVVRTRPGVRPVYVSPGHRVELDDAVRWVLATCKGFRLPEPCRAAHRAAAARRPMPMG